VDNRCITSASEQSTAVTSRVRREEADALRKVSDDGESEIGSKISRKELEEHPGTDNHRSNFEDNHFEISSGSDERAMAGSFPGDSARCPVDPAREGKPALKKNYAVGLEMSCSGAAYAWAPEIPMSIR
jgi:hypothetical protein